MTIIGIDPGPEKSAVVCWNPYDGISQLHGIYENEHVLEFIGPYCEEVVIEMISSFGMPVGKEVFETVFWIGRFFEKTNGTAHRILRSQVKMNLCQSMRAKDGNIRQALIDRFGPQGTKKAPGYTYGLKGDEWQAFAVAVTFYDSIKGEIK